MRVENLQFNNIQQIKSALAVRSTVSDSSGRSFETSIYDKKGVTLPFGCWAKGASEAEEVCIRTFRKVRDGRCRKYTEPQIVGFMSELHAVPKDQNLNRIVGEFFETYKICFEEFGAPISKRPDADLVRNYLKVAKNFDDDERLGLIGFTQHELCQSATRPLETLANAPVEQQKRFVGLMNDISFSRTANEDKTERLYEDLRHVIYASEDLPKLDEKGRLQYLSEVQSDYKALKAEDDYESPEAKKSVVGIARDIVDTMMDVLKI